MNNAAPTFFGIIGLNLEHEKLRFIKSSDSDIKLPSESVLYAFSKIFKSEFGHNGNRKDY